jgi:serine protease
VALPGRFLRHGTAQAAAPFTPDDPGRVATPAGWTRLQWNFAGPYGVDAPQAWGNWSPPGLLAAPMLSSPFLDTGLAYGAGLFTAPPQARAQAP